MNPSAPISALKRVLHVLDELGNEEAAPRRGELILFLRSSRPESQQAPSSEDPFQRHGA